MWKDNLEDRKLTNFWIRNYVRANCHFKLSFGNIAWKPQNTELNKTNWIPLIIPLFWWKPQSGKLSHNNSQVKLYWMQITRNFGRHRFIFSKISILVDDFYFVLTKCKSTSKTVKRQEVDGTWKICLWNTVFAIFFIAKATASVSAIWMLHNNCSYIFQFAFAKKRPYYIIKIWFKFNKNVASISLYTSALAHSYPHHFAMQSSAKRTRLRLA